MASFAPYIGVPLGQSTSVSAASLLGVFALPMLMRFPRALLWFVCILALPLVATGLAVAVGREIPNSAALLSWVLYLLPAAGFLVVAIRSPRSFVMPIRICLIVNGAYAAFQQASMVAGTLPFLEYYRLPGFASVASQLETIVMYVRRPFALFPEPSFMAGSVALAAACLVLIRHMTADRLGVVDIVAVSVAGLTIYASNSGSALVSISLLLVLVAWPMVSGVGRGAVLVGALLAASLVGGAILDARSTGYNWSWDDRMASIYGAFRYMIEDLGVLLLGVGRGTSTVLFQTREIPLDGLQYSHYPPDIFSVLGRILFESGLVIGSAIILLLLVPLVRAPRVGAGFVYRVAIAGLWLLVAGLTISYESGVWIWALPAVAAGILFSRNGPVVAGANVR